MTRPVRLQLSRRKGFDLQENSRGVNGLPAVKVDRSTKWGNPYKAWPEIRKGDFFVPATTIEEAVAAFRASWERSLSKFPEQTRELLGELRGKNLACWCKPGEPCHADVLLEFANGPVCEEVRP